MGQSLKVATWIIANQKIDVTEMSDGEFIFEKLDSDDRWFVCSSHKGKYFLQENLEQDGEVIELGEFDSMVDALYKLAWCGKMNFA
jgi:hypothetical protein